MLRSKLVYWLSHPRKKVSSAADKSYKAGSFSAVNQNTVNIKRGLGYTDNNEELYINLLKRFVTNYGSLGINSKTPLTHETETKLHNLKGIAGSLGAEALRKATITLETSFKKKIWDRRNLEVFIKRYADTISDCEEILAEYWEKEGRTQASPVLAVNDEMGSEQLKNTLIRLRDSLSQCDPIMCRQIVSEMEAMSHPGYTAHMFDSIFQKIFEYRYDDADKQVEKLIGRIEMEG